MRFAVQYKLLDVIRVDPLRPKASINLLYTSLPAVELPLEWIKISNTTVHIYSYEANTHQIYHMPNQLNFATFNNSDLKVSNSWKG